MSTSGAGWACRRSLLATFLVCLLVVASGCLTVDATLDADGSATIDLTYPTQPGRGAEQEKAGLRSDHVTVESFELKDDHVHAKVKVDDVTKLSTAPFFKDVSASVTDDGDNKVLKVVITKATTVTVKEQKQPGPKFTFKLPGKAVKANGDGKISGDQVTWSFSLAAYAAEKKTELEVTYAAGSGKATGEAATEESAKDKAPGAAE